MTIRLQAFAVAAVAGILAFSGTQAAETPYYKNVSDIEVETAVKGETYDKANDKTSSSGFFSNVTSPGSAPCCACENSVGAAATPAVPGAPKTAAASADNTDRLRVAIAQLSTASWQNAQTLLIESGKASIPVLIDALTSSEPAYNLGGHTKSDAGRLPRQRTVGEVAAELLADIVTYHTSYKGEIPGADQAAWREWWSKNAEGVKFASN